MYAKDSEIRGTARSDGVEVITEEGVGSENVRAKDSTWRVLSSRKPFGVRFNDLLRDAIPKNRKPKRVASCEAPGQAKRSERRRGSEAFIERRRPERSGG